MGKKKEYLTLEDAMVPREEWPYEVPEGWVWTKLDYIAFVTKLAGFEYTKYIAPNLTDFGMPLVKGKNIQNGELIYSFEDYIPQNISNELLRSKLTKKCLLTPYVGNIGNVAIYDGNLECHLGSNVGKIEILDDKSGIASEEFLMYFLKSIYGNKELNKHKKATAQDSISIGAIRDVNVPIPPLPEQQRIVNRIESLFEKLDRAKEIIQIAIDSFESRKASLLHKAFSGELTRKWREENGVGMESWEEKKLGELCNSFQYGTSKKSQSNGDIVVIRMGNLQNGEIDWNDLAYTNDKDDIKKYYLKNGDVLFNRTNSSELVGKTSIYRGEYPAIFAGYIIRLNYKVCLDSEYLNYIMNSIMAKEYCNKVKTDGVNQSNINAKKIAEFFIPYCSLPEQKEIVRIVNYFYERENRVKELFVVIDNIDSMKKSILAKAFRGKLA